MNDVRCTMYGLPSGALQSIYDSLIPDFQFSITSTVSLFAGVISNKGVPSVPCR